MKSEDTRVFVINSVNVSLADKFLSEIDIEKIKTGTISAVGCIVGNTVVGVMLYDATEDGVYLIHGFSVASDMDGYAVKDIFIEWITENARDDEASIFCSFRPDSILEEIFLKHGFFLMDSNDDDIEVPIKDLFSLKIMQTNISKEAIEDRQNIGKTTLQGFITKRLEDSSVFRVMYHSSKIQKYAIVDDKIVGCIIGSFFETDSYSIDYVYTDSRHRHMVIALLKAFVDDISQMDNAENARLIFTTVNDVSKNLARKLLEDKGIYEHRKNAIFI